MNSVIMHESGLPTLLSKKMKNWNRFVVWSCSWYFIQYVPGGPVSITSWTRSGWFGAGLTLNTNAPDHDCLLFATVKKLGGRWLHWRRRSSPGVHGGDVQDLLCFICSMYLLRCFQVQGSKRSNGRHLRGLSIEQWQRGGLGRAGRLSGRLWLQWSWL